MPKDKIVNFKCREELWVAVFATKHALLSRGYLGRCYEENKTIAVRKSLKGILACDTAIHEFTHSYFPDLKEDAVDIFASQLAVFLRDTGMLNEDWTIEDIH